LPVKKGDPGGNLGLANVGFGFKPPEGISVALSAPAVSGVGFLDIDTEHHQYLGAIAISVGDIDISAVGVLNTKLPTGPGYSLIVVVSASFPPIELGFGFDLTGIGGLVGVNRTVDVPGLQALARSGGLDELMFPEDLIHKAPQVAASLAAVFPPALQHFLIGPAVRLEWGADGILDAQIGVLIELSDAGGGISILRIALLGFFHITLPQAEAPVADITLDVLGLLDIPAKFISIDAGMRNSKVAGFTLTGQAALRASWGAHASFVLAIGGFNPAFNAPAGFPILARIALSLGDDNPRLRFASYFALTPNTLQFGASADLYASKGPVAVTASLSFDVLIQFKPFGLLVDLTISAAILFNNSPLLTMNLALHLSGPDPWHVTGSASITVLFATFSVPINVTIGDTPAPQLPVTVSLDKNLTDALADLHNWQIGPPAGGGGVVVRGFDQASKGVHPMASLTVRQHAVPLHQQIDRYGPDLVSPCSYDITRVQLGSQVVPDTGISPVPDQFAPAQFITMSDADKLSAPSFEPMEAGVTIGAAGLVLPLTGPAADPHTLVIDCPSTRQYDLLTMDVPDAVPAPPPPPRRRGGDGTGDGTRRQLGITVPIPPARRPVTMPDELLRVQRAGAAAAVNGVDGRGAARYRGPVTGFAVVHPRWAILGLNLTATRADGRVLRTDLSSKTAARSWMEREVPRASVQVVYKSEMPGSVALGVPAKRV
ncbi:MAG TPA: DUF6603 domain-containing protein, partial [Candidatus Dormibacteraeota bacterium]|nr:DUF6603 domain-containing protein [Candidatus Dormibacteraeota bacterium]